MHICTVHSGCIPVPPLRRSISPYTYLRHIFKSHIRKHWRWIMTLTSAFVDSPLALSTCQEPESMQHDPRQPLHRFLAPQSHFVVAANPDYREGLLGPKLSGVLLGMRADDHVIYTSNERWVVLDWSTPYRSPNYEPSTVRLGVLEMDMSTVEIETLISKHDEY